MGDNLVCGVISSHFIRCLLFIARQQTKPSDINKLTLCSNQKRFHLHITDSKMSAPPKRLPRLPFSRTENPAIRKAKGNRMQSNMRTKRKSVKGQMRPDFFGNTKLILQNNRGPQVIPVYSNTHVWRDIRPWTHVRLRYFEQMLTQDRKFPLFPTKKGKYVMAQEENERRESPPTQETIQEASAESMFVC